MIVNLKVSSGLAVFVIYVIFLTVSIVSAVERPSPDEFSEEIGLFWYEKKYQELESRVTEVYGAHSDFIPAIIAASFVEGVFWGKMADSREKIGIVKEYIDDDPESFDEVFVVGVQALLDMIDKEMAWHAEAGVTPEELEANASPAAVREASGVVLIPFLVILAFAPDEEIPDTTE